MFKRSRDAAFDAKAEDVFALYMPPSAQTVALSIDEQSENQALRRLRPNRSLAHGHPAVQTHAYAYHGNTMPFAALDVLAGYRTRPLHAAPKSGAFIRFLNAVEATVPSGKAIHVILVNVATQKHPMA